MRWRRTGAVAKWLCTTLILLLVALWAASPWYSGVWVFHPFCRLEGLSFLCDELEVSWRSRENPGPDYFPSLPFYGRLHTVTHPRYLPHRWRWLPEFKSNSVRGWVTVPIWLPVALLMVPTAIPWYRVFRRWRRGRRMECRSCGYDRHGIAADAKCPECGVIPATPPK